MNPLVPFLVFLVFLGPSLWQLNESSVIFCNLLSTCGKRKSIFHRHFPDLFFNFFHFFRLAPAVSRFEGNRAGIRPDYLVNRVLTKNEGPHPKKIVRKSRNSRRLNSGGVGARGQLTRSSNRVSLETNANAQRILFVSRLLRSFWYPLVPNCCSFPHSF